VSFATTFHQPVMTRPRPVRILLVEDSPADIELTRQALAEAEVANEVVVLTDGDSAARYLRRDGDYAAAPRPDLVLLDLNLPKKDGRELLVEIKHDPELRMIPVIVLTTSASDDDVCHAYREHVNSYLRKPVRLKEFIDLVRAIDQYWLGTVTLPPSQEDGL
jgi:chemotaxis family two-component system response regulator Rcp1